MPRRPTTGSEVARAAAAVGQALASARRAAVATAAPSVLTAAQLMDFQSRELTAEDLEVLLRLDLAGPTLAPEAASPRRAAPVLAEPPDTSEAPPPHRAVPEPFPGAATVPAARASASLAGAAPRSRSPRLYTDGGVTGGWRRTTTGGWRPARDGVGTAGAAEVESLPTVAADFLEDGASCAICLEDLSGGVVGAEVCALPRCGHAFHRPCLELWLTRGKAVCPMDKSSVF